MTDTVNIPVESVAAAARALALAGRWALATDLLRTAGGDDPRLLLAAAEVAVAGDWFRGTAEASDALARVPGDGWDAAFLRLRDVYRQRFGQPDETLRAQARMLLDTAPDETRRGWAAMYAGLIADNLFRDRGAASGWYAAALAASGSDPLLRREALRHLGDHAHDAGDHAGALSRWREATAIGAAAGNVPGTLSQQLLLAVLSRDAGDEPGAVALAEEVARWAGALGAARLEAQARAFITGTDPTRP